jgi:hypothetical protein
MNLLYYIDIHIYLKRAARGSISVLPHRPAFRKPPVFVIRQILRGFCNYLINRVARDARFTQSVKERPPLVLRKIAEKPPTGRHFSWC